MNQFENWRTGHETGRDVLSNGVGAANLQDLSTGIDEDVEGAGLGLIVIVPSRGYQSLVAGHSRGPADDVALRPAEWPGRGLLHCFP
jgi:hypothetical protein